MAIKIHSGAREGSHCKAEVRIVCPQVWAVSKEMWKNVGLSSAAVTWLHESLLLHCLQNTFPWMLLAEEAWFLPGSLYVVWLHRQGVLHIAEATHVRLGPSFEVWIQVSSYLKVEDQRFGSFSAVFFSLLLWSGSCVKTGCCREIRWTVNRREKHLYLFVSVKVAVHQLPAVRRS